MSSPMQATSTWDEALRAPAPRDHLVQLYTSDSSLVSIVAHFIERGVADGDGVVALTTAIHWTGIEPPLAARGVDAAAAQARGQLVVIEAGDALARLLIGGTPDRAALREIIVPAVTGIRSAGYARVRAFGEMVDLLNRDGRLPAALRLEELWNELLEAERIALLCAYGVDPFDRAAHATTLPSIGHVHSHMMLVDDPPRLDRAVDRAFIDVFGLYGDARLLRELFVRHLADGAAMPTAQAALFALRDVDTRLADAILERAASHYRSD